MQKPIVSHGEIRSKKSWTNQILIVNTKMNCPIYMPDGKPVPEVMLESELITFLRLNELGVKKPANTLRYYREQGKLKATRIGNRNAYTRTAACEFLQEMTKKNSERT
jgi:hypothetical protein